MDPGEACSEVDDQLTYEITVVDHINKAMLDSFKKHLEADDLPLARIENNPDQGEDNDAEWDAEETD